MDDQINQGTSGEGGQDVVPNVEDPEKEAEFKGGEVSKADPSEVAESLEENDGVFDDFDDIPTNKLGDAAEEGDDQVIIA